MEARNDRKTPIRKKYCPLTGKVCRQKDCVWWVERMLMDKDGNVVENMSDCAIKRMEFKMFLDDIRAQQMQSRFEMQTSVDADMPEGAGENRKEGNPLP